MEQPVPSTVPEGVLSTTKVLKNRVSEVEISLSAAKVEEVATKGSEELSNSNWEEEPQKGFSSPRDQGSTIKIPIVKLNDYDLVK